VGGCEVGSRTRLSAGTRAVLRDADATSLEIAHELGYRDASNFARAFRRLTGVNPRKFRQANPQQL
ncbi:MAG: helix-turn-helix domain-containing protein, partial [Polyangiaceae bacterium]